MNFVIILACAASMILNLEISDVNNGNGNNVFSMTLLLTLEFIASEQSVLLVSQTSTNLSNEEVSKKR